MKSNLALYREYIDDCLARDIEPLGYVAFLGHATNERIIDRDERVMNRDESRRLYSRTRGRITRED